MLRYVVDYFVARTLWNWAHRPPRPHPPEPHWAIVGHRFANLLMLAGLALLLAVLAWAFVATL